MCLHGPAQCLALTDCGAELIKIAIINIPKCGFGYQEEGKENPVH